MKRAHEPHAGKWALPGGAVEAGERITEALVREVREETGLSAVPGSFVAFTELIAGGAGEKPAHHYIILTFKAGVEGGRLEPGTDAADARWFRLDELVGIELSETTVGLLRRAGLISINQ
ncbi:MAG: NUDIX domain-containing protein [Firmicutes bacterium]|nr:NUDIX domain-containing protein [Bacillota bacterium]